VESEIKINKKYHMCELQKSIDYFSGRWKKKLESYHDIFLEREKLMSDESKRPGHSINTSELLGFEGSFRKLDVD
jgi:hypothetical protein